MTVEDITTIYPVEKDGLHDISKKLIRGKKQFFLPKRYYDTDGHLVERHQKFPIDTGHQKIES